MMMPFAAASPHISVKAEELVTVGGVSITNSTMAGALGVVILLLLFVWTHRVAVGKAKPNFATKLMTWAFDGLYNTVAQIIPDREIAKKVAPLPITIFFFVLVQYWTGILPFVGPAVYVPQGVEHTPLLRSQVADLNMTFALAIITIVAAQVYAIKYLGFFGNAGRYLVNPIKNPIGTFVGLLELIAEFSRMLGLSFRLFGNVLAGEVLLIMIAFLAQYISPIALQPFFIFELFIGGIQAYIFFMLSTVFISLGLGHHGGDEKEHATTSSAHSSSASVATEG